MRHTIRHALLVLGLAGVLGNSAPVSAVVINFGGEVLASSVTPRNADWLGLAGGETVTGVLDYDVYSGAIARFEVRLGGIGWLMVGGFVTNTSLAPPFPPYELRVEPETTVYSFTPNSPLFFFDTLSLVGTDITGTAIPPPYLPGAVPGVSAIEQFYALVTGGEVVGSVQFLELLPTGGPPVPSPLSFDFQFTSVDAPATWLLLALGFPAMVVAARSRG